MKKNQKRKVKKRLLKAKTKGNTHPKLDARLSFVLSLSKNNLSQLKKQEDDMVKNLSNEIQSLEISRRSIVNESEQVKKLEEIDSKLFAPITSGVYFDFASQTRKEDLSNSTKKKNKRQPSLDIKEPYISAFILSDASSEDLSKLGVKVRSQAGDVFTALIPLSVIPKLEDSTAIRFIELARPLFPTLNYVIPFTQINSLQSAIPPVNGSGIIVGVIDSVLDIYHPDFRTTGNATRVLFIWDQNLIPLTGESGPPMAPTLPGFCPFGGTTYGVEYDQTKINAELNNYNPPTVPAYQIVRHSVPEPPITGSNGHGTFVTGCAAGNGLAQSGTFTGAAPAADIIFVSPQYNRDMAVALYADNTFVLDAFAYIFARATQLGQACVINLSSSDNQGPHDGSTLGEQFLDNLLLTPGRVVTLSAGNSNNSSSHASGTITAGTTTNLVLNYRSADLNRFPVSSDDIEIWYDGHDRFDATLTIPTDGTPTIIGPISPGGPVQTTTLSNGVQVIMRSILNDARNNDNVISIIITVPDGQHIPLGDWTIALTGNIVINGNFHAWIDRNNRFLSAWQPPFLQENQLTLGVPSTARRPITVGNHDKTSPIPSISGSSGCGTTRDGRIKPEIATVGTNISASSPRNMNFSLDGQPLYQAVTGTSFSAPLTAGACALLFQCRGLTSTCANIKQILEDTAGTSGLSIPNNAFGFGFLQMNNTCIQPVKKIVDVWVRDDVADTGIEPFSGNVFWLCPDMQILDSNGNPVPNPRYNPSNRFNNIIRITVRNQGTQLARNTEVYLYWADPATNIPFPSGWNSTGIYTGSPQFLSQGNKIIIPQLDANSFTTVDFAWAPPAAGGNLRGDDHFSLLVRLENKNDNSQIATGGWSFVRAKNNLALRNVHVQNIFDNGDAEMRFYVVGSPDQDSLVVYTELVDGKVILNLPIQALPWRDINLIEKHKAQRLGYGWNNFNDPLTKMKITVSGEEIHMRTDITGAEMLELQNGVASILASKKDNLFIPYVRLAEGTKFPASIQIKEAKTDSKQHYIHVAQLSGGQRVGGATLDINYKEHK